VLAGDAHPHELLAHPRDLVHGVSARRRTPALFDIYEIIIRNMILRRKNTPPTPELLAGRMDLPKKSRLPYQLPLALEADSLVGLPTILAHEFCSPEFGPRRGRQRAQVGGFLKLQLLKQLFVVETGALGGETRFINPNTCLRERLHPKIICNFNVCEILDRYAISMY
jgi:hypothetical protein